MNAHSDQQLINSDSSQRPVTSHRRRILMADALDLEQLIMGKARDAQITAFDLSNLVRCFCSLMECIRIMRNKPLPGQLQPSMDPARMARKLKSIRRVKALDIRPEAIVEAPQEAGQPKGIS